VTEFVVDGKRHEYQSSLSRRVRRWGQVLKLRVTLPLRILSRPEILTFRIGNFSGLENQSAYDRHLVGHLRWVADFVRSNFRMGDQTQSLHPSGKL
jgi:hypothetical protein